MSYARDLARLGRSGFPSVGTAQELRDLPIYDDVPPRGAETFGALTEDDRGGGSWRWDAASTADDNLGTVLLPTFRTDPGRWVRRAPKYDVDVAWWGPVEGGTVDCSEAFQAAIDYAETLDVATVLGRGITVRIQEGVYLISTELQINGQAVSFWAEPGRGAELRGPGNIMCFGERDTYVTRTQGCGCHNIIFASNDKDNTSSAGLTLWRTAYFELHNCKFWDFNIGVDCYRASTTFITDAKFNNQGRLANADAFIRLQGTDETLYGETHSPGGGMHISDCEFQGRNDTTNFTKAGILVNAVDGLYISQTHIVQTEVALKLDNLATGANRTIIDVNVVNCYFDGPSGTESSARNFAITGSLSLDVPCADGSTEESLCQGFRFSNTYFRAATDASFNVIIDINDNDTWDADAGSAVEPIIFTGCEFRQANKQAVTIPSGTSNIYPRSMMFNGCHFDDYNFSRTEDINGAAAMDIRAKSVTVNGCSFANKYADMPWIIISSDPTDYLIANNNNFSSASYTGTPIRNSLEDAANAVIIDGNMVPGLGRYAQLTVKVTTTDATEVETAIYVVAEGNSGYGQFTVVGTGPSGEIVSARFAGGYYRIDDGNLTLESGTSDFPLVGSVWNPHTAAASPRVGKDPAGVSTIKLWVTGKAAETWTWIVSISLMEGT